MEIVKHDRKVENIKNFDILEKFTKTIRFFYLVYTI